MDRKKFKQNGKKSFHKHYWILMFVCLILSLFGTEASSSVRLLTLETTSEQSSTILNASGVFESIVQGDSLEKTQTLSDFIEKNIPENFFGNKALSTTSGVLSGVVKSVMSGKLFVSLANALFSATHSKTATRILFVLIAFLVVAALYVFVRNILSALVRRMFLESRTYAKVPFLSFVHPATVRKWFQACWALLLKNVFYFLWCFTIVGAFVKYYSYYMVPFIVAENPGIKALDAITLSRKMMNGHKWEAFVFDLSFIGWYLLALVTIGVSDLFYGFPYRTAARAEYYAYLRQLAKDNKIEKAELMDDVYLYEHAEKIPLYEAYFDVVDLQTEIHEKKITLSGAKAFVLRWFSIWLGKYEDKKRYDEVEAYKFEIQRNIISRDGLAYPLRLNPRWKQSRIKVKVPFHFMRGYSVWTLILMFLLFCFIGWCWEVFFYYIKDGVLVNRGVLHGPWLPVYGAGGIVVLLVCSSFRKWPVVELIVSVVLCGVIEYVAAVMLETRYHERWWSYDGNFLNIDGRVCGEGLIVFGIACMLAVYLIAPFFDHLVMKMPKRVLQVVTIVLFAIFLCDVFYSQVLGHPNMSEGAIEKHDKKTSAVYLELQDDFYGSKEAAV